MSAKKTTKSKKPIWNEKLTKELALLKKLALKNNSLFICGVTMSEDGRVEGTFFSDGVSPILIAETVISELPFEAVKMALIKTALRGNLKEFYHDPSCPNYKAPKSSKKPVKKGKK